jgi:transposase
LGVCYKPRISSADSPVRRALEGNNNKMVIPGRKNRKKEIVYDKEEYKKRGEIEKVFGKIKENRRLTVRYEKSDINFLGFIFIAFIRSGV